MRKAFMGPLAVLGCVVAVSSWVYGQPPPPVRSPRPVITPRPIPSGDPGPIRIGVINSLTGPYTAYADPVRDGLLLAQEQINAKGGIRGRKVELVVEDDYGDAQRAAAAFEKLAAAKVPVVIGPITAAGSKAVAPLANRSRIVMLSPIAHSPELTRAGRYVFLVVPTTDVQAREKSRLVIGKFQPKRVAMLNDANPLANVAVEVWKKRLSAAGAEVVAEESFKEGDKDFKDRLTKIRDAKPDIVVYPAYYDEETVAIVKQARELGIRAPLVGSGSACLAALDKIGPLVLPELYFVDEAFGPAISRDVAPMQTFMTDYSQKFNRKAGLESAAAHAALNMVKTAMETGGFTAAATQRGLRGKAFQTALGQVKYGETGANVSARFALFNMTGQGELAVVR
jgi:branched-chain amino acid transport system substrate-binding protein